MHSPHFTQVVRGLLIEHGYTGPRCEEEFGVGAAWYSSFMRGAERCKADLLQEIYEKLTGKPLIHPDVAARVNPVDKVVIGTGGWRKVKEKPQSR